MNFVILLSLLSTLAFNMRVGLSASDPDACQKI